MKRQLTLPEFDRIGKVRKVQKLPVFEGFEVIKTAADGSCLFAAIAHQLNLSTTASPVCQDASSVRRSLVSFLRENPSIFVECGTLPDGWST